MARRIVPYSPSKEVKESLMNMTHAVSSAATANELAKYFQCSAATVNMKAAKLGFKLRGRTEGQHSRLIAALEVIKPRKKVVLVNKAVEKAPAIEDSVKAYFDQGIQLKSTIRKRIQGIEQEQADLQKKLDALVLLHETA